MGNGSESPLSMMGDAVTAVFRVVGRVDGPLAGDQAPKPFRTSVPASAGRAIGRCRLEVGHDSHKALPSTEAKNLALTSTPGERHT